MRAVLRRHLTYANVVATVCLFVVLGGGAYAATQLPKNSVGPKQLKKGAVTPAKVSKQARKQLRGNTGSAGPAGPAGPSGAGPAFETFQASEKVVGLSGKSPQPLLSLSNLPAGSYSFLASAMAGAGSGGQFQVFCTLATGGAAGSGAPAPIGAGVVGLAGTNLRLPTMSLQQVHTFSSPGGSVRLECFEEGNQAGEHAYILNARLTAIQVQSQSSLAG